MPLLLEIVTPERKVFSGEVETVVLPAPQGEIGILPQHIPLLTLMEPGELRITAGGQTTNLAVDKGFIQVLGDKVAVLTEAAIDVQKIDARSVEEARRRAEQALEEARQKGEDPAVLEELQTKARFALAQRLAKEKRQ